MTDTRVPVPDPALMRRGARRTLVALIVAEVLLTVVTAGGVSLLVAGELPGLPLAVGGLAAQLLLLVLAVAVLRVPRTLDADTISRDALATAARVSATTWRLAAVAAVGLLGYGLLRAALGDLWSLLTAGLLGLVLALVAARARTLARAQRERLTPPG